MNELTLQIDLINAIMQYLGSRPYVEVAGLITAIQTAASNQGAEDPVALDAPAAE
jgi:hypothetical protein